MSTTPGTLSEVQPAASPRKRWVKWLLTASLALNALIIGGFVGAVWRHGGPPNFAQNVPGNLLTYVDSIPRHRERENFGKMKEYRRSLQPLRKSIQEARRGIVAAIAQEPFDRAAFIAAQKHLSELESSFRAEQANFLADVAGGLTADERRGYGRWWEQRRNRGRSRSLEDEGEQPAKK